MNKKLVAVIFAFAVIITSYAQDGNRGGQGRGFGGMRRTVAERVAIVHAKFDSTFHFATDKQTKVDTVFAEQYRAQDALRAEMMAGFTPGQQPDPEAMKTAREKMQEKMQELQVTRDEKLQNILTDVEYKKWKDELEPAMRPQRGQGRGDGGRSGNGGGTQQKANGN